jgi:hypothetical protein
MSVNSGLDLFSAALEGFKETAVHRHAGYAREGHPPDIEIGAPILKADRASEGKHRELTVPYGKEGLRVVLIEDAH